MVMILDLLVERLNNLSWIEYFTFAVNAFVFLFSKQIAQLHGEIDEVKQKQDCVLFIHLTSQFLQPSLSQ